MGLVTDSEQPSYLGKQGTNVPFNSDSRKPDDEDGFTKAYDVIWRTFLKMTFESEASAGRELEYGIRFDREENWLQL